MKCALKPITLEKKTEKESFSEMYKALTKTIEDILKISNVKFTKLETGFKKYVEIENLPESFVNELKSFTKSYTDFKAKKLTKAESDKVKREVRTFIRAIVEHEQRKKFLGVERAKIKFKHAGNIGEIILLKDKAFITKNIKERDKIEKVDIVKGRLKNPEKSTKDIYERSLVDTEIQQAINLNAELFSDLEKIVGKDIELLL